MRGNSGAVITIDGDLAHKSGGPHDLLGQVEMLRLLGPVVCPVVHDHGPESYTMERLHQIAEPPSQSLILRVFELLREHVWSIPLDSAPEPWFRDVEIWCRREAPWIECGLARELYLDGFPMHYALTHGDPTLANVMQRVDGTLVLIDPLPPRSYAPSLPEVDVGKLLQSAAGWESVLAGGDGAPVPAPRPWPWETVGGSVTARCHFWAAVHCARIIRYARTPQIREWCERVSRDYVGSAIDAGGV